MIVQNSLLLLQEIGTLEKKISQIEKVIHNQEIDLDLEEILQFLIRKTT